MTKLVDDGEGETRDEDGNKVVKGDKTFKQAKLIGGKKF